MKKINQVNNKGQRHGKWWEKDVNNNSYIIQHYKNGLLHGKSVNYWEDNGVMSYFHFKNGLLHGKGCNYDPILNNNTISFSKKIIRTSKYKYGLMVETTFVGGCNYYWNLIEKYNEIKIYIVKTNRSKNHLIKIIGSDEIIFKIKYNHKKEIIYYWDNEGNWFDKKHMLFDCPFEYPKIDYEVMAK